MTDFSYFPEVFKGYGGANGSKIAVKTPDGVYMIKFPGMANKNTEMSYANGCISEHLGSSIFNMAGIPAQETMLGWYSLNNTKKLVVACKDFTYPDYEFYDFGQIKNTYPGCTSNGYGTDLEDIMECIEHKQPGNMSNKFLKSF